MSLLSHNEQYDLIERMRLENEATTEQDIRKAATEYLSRRPDPQDYYHSPQRMELHFPVRPANLGPPSFGTAQYHAPTHIYTARLFLDVAPGIQGFEAQIIAEEQLREQIGQLDTT